MEFGSRVTECFPELRSSAHSRHWWTSFFVLLPSPFFLSDLLTSPPSSTKQKTVWQQNRAQFIRSCCLCIDAWLLVSAVDMFPCLSWSVHFRRCLRYRMYQLFRTNCSEHAQKVKKKICRFVGSSALERKYIVHFFHPVLTITVNKILTR